MGIKKSKIILILIFSFAFLIGIFIGTNLNSNNDIKYGEYVTVTFENNKSTLSLGLEEGKYYYAENGLKSVEGNLTKIGDNIYKFNTGKLENSYIILRKTQEDKTIYIHDNYTTVCNYINNHLTLIGG